MKSFAITATLAFLLSACGGGGGSASSTPDQNTPAPAPAPAPAPVPAVASLTAKPLAGDKVRLTLSGVSAQASRYCIRQDTTQPPASDPCFTDSDSTALVQEKTIAAPSNTQRVVFTAWVLADGTVSRHASVSAPGKTCSTTALAALPANTTLPAVCIITSSGESVLLLESVKAPITVANFLRYVNQGFYDQTVFHRFLKTGTQVVQGGSLVYDGSNYVSKASTLPAIVLEPYASTGLSNTAGTIAMARTSELDSATSGFFVNTSDNSVSYDKSTARDPSAYAVFGRFIYGAAVWNTMLASVNNNELDSNSTVISSSPPRWLHWAYQIQ